MKPQLIGKHNQTTQAISQEMTSRERLQAVLNHRLPDRVPISTYGLVGYNSERFENQDSSIGFLIA